jgi:hypothetical protein
MVAFYRSASVPPGKSMSAIADAKEVAAFATQVTGVEVRVAIPLGGNPFRIGCAARYENLGAMEAAMGKLMADPKDADFSAKSAEHFIAGSFSDEIWRAV